MKLRKLFVSVFCAVSVLSTCLCGCREIKPESVANGSFGGIAFDTSAKTAESAAPLPLSAESSETEKSSSPTETEASSETITTTASSKAAATAPKTTTIAITTTTTTTAAITTTTTTTTALTTTTTTPATTTTTTTTTAPAATTTTAASEEISQNTGYPKNSYNAVNYEEMRGVWISYLEISVLLRQKTEAQFREAAGKIFDNCLDLGLNTVYVHARAFGDAFYFSELFPFTKHISGSVGVKTAYDPYKILISEAHARGLSFHAWINPLRLCSTADMSEIPPEFTIKKWHEDPAKNGTYIVNINGTWYLNPAYDEVIGLVGDGVREIVSAYDVDGVHIDDYFYPTTDASFDSAAFAASGSSSLSSYRIDRCNNLVKEIYSAAHECSSAIFGASTQGNMSNNINQLYADAAAWCKGGYVDYFAPQIYYGFDNSAQPFEACTDEWNALVRGTKTNLCIGLAVYKIGQEDKWAGEGRYEWQNTDTMLKRQTEYARSCENYGGIALYSYNYLFTEGYVTPAIKKEKENLAPIL